MQWHLFTLVCFDVNGLIQRCTNILLLEEEESSELKNTDANYVLLGIRRRPNKFYIGKNDGAFTFKTVVKV